MDFPYELLINAVIAGLLLGGFYAAVTVGISISFGMLDIVNIAHPAFIIVGSYIAYNLNVTYGFDPILSAIVVVPLFYALGWAIYQVYYHSFEKRGRDPNRARPHRYSLLWNGPRRPDAARSGVFGGAVLGTTDAIIVYAAASFGLQPSAAMVLTLVLRAEQVIVALALALWLTTARRSSGSPEPWVSA